jgi:hypothetical protein
LGASADRTQSPARVSEKREFFNEWPETFGIFSPQLWKLGVWRPPAELQKPAIGGPAIGGFSAGIGAQYSEHRTAWLGREDSNLRMGESKSPALPLGDAPIRLIGKRRQMADPLPCGNAGL